MVIIRKRPKTFEDVFKLVEESIARSLEETRKILERIAIPEEEAVFEPPFDLIDAGDKYVIELDIPGVSKDDIQIYAYDNTLEVKAERKVAKKEKKEGVIKVERFWSTYHRVITLPTDADVNKIKAKYENGVLRIEIGKKEGFKKRIQVE